MKKEEQETDDGNPDDGAALDCDDEDNSLAVVMLQNEKVSINRRVCYLLSLHYLFYTFLTAFSASLKCMLSLAGVPQN